MRSFLAAAWLLLSTPLFAVLAILSVIPVPSGRGASWPARTWARLTLAIAGVRVRTVGRDRLPGHGPTLFMSTHQSNLDVICLLTVLPGHVRFVAKRSLGFVPFFGWALVTGRHILIDRSNREGAIRSLERAGRRIRSGFSVLVFPEGTRTRDGRLGEFKKGAFHLAAAARVPVAPVAVRGTARLMPRKRLRIGAGDVELIFGDPISVADGAEPAAIRESVRRALAGLLGDGVDETHPGFNRTRARG